MRAAGILVDGDLFPGLPSRDRPARVTLAVVAGVLETLPESRSAALIARLRDVLAENLWVLVGPTAAESPPRLSATDLTALGLRRLASYEEDRGTTHLFGFDISSYKKTPEWLSPENWANPERWEKARW